MTSRSVTLLWFRRDLRLQDNPALVSAIKRGVVVPLFIWNDCIESSNGIGEMSRVWLRHSLEQLSLSLGRIGARLIIRKGDYLRVLREMLLETGADEIYWNRILEPNAMAVGNQVREALENAGFACKVFDNQSLLKPWLLLNQQGEPYRVFTPFWKKAKQEIRVSEPLQAPQRFVVPIFWPGSAPLRDLSPINEADEARLNLGKWQPGEEGAANLLQTFLSSNIDSYDSDRDRPDLDTTSRLSPHLHFGEITPRQVLSAMLHHAEVEHPDKLSEAASVFYNQLGWREFAQYLLFHFPCTVDQPLRQEFEQMSWVSDPEGLEAWKTGMTGYPIVDAGMRQLMRTGWMHNRVRMIVASFLTKDLLIHWKEGAHWFYQNLVDADLANNTLGWQWTAGCGADAAPYFRIFNPVIQGKSFDPDGEYVHKWVPELSALPAKHIHAPWDAPQSVLDKAGIILGQHYPERIVEHEDARRRALAAYDRMRLERSM